jgi:hypothetical protein
MIQKYKFIRIENMIHYLNNNDKHYLCKIEDNFRGNHQIIPKNNKILIHSTRNIKDLRESLLKLCNDNNINHRFYSDKYYKKYDVQGQIECDILFNYDDIKQNKTKEIIRLIDFFKNKNIIKNMDIKISDVIDYADNINLELKNHKKW